MTLCDGLIEAAATLAGFAFSPVTTQSVTELNTVMARLREALGESVYESCTHAGAQMTTAAMASYAYDQIDQARTEVA